MHLEMYQVCVSFYSILNVRIEVQICGRKFSLGTTKFSAYHMVYSHIW